MLPPADLPMAIFMTTCCRTYALRATNHLADYVLPERHGRQDRPGRPRPRPPSRPDPWVVLTSGASVATPWRLRASP